MRLPRARLLLVNRHRVRGIDVKRIEDSLYGLKPLGRRGRRRIDVILVDDPCISDLAGRYRGSRRATDVLAFRYDDDLMPYGEIVVSLDTAARQAKERDMRIEDEVLLLVLHGLLHISGQGDETYGDWCMMRRFEFEAMMGIL